MNTKRLPPAAGPPSPIPGRERSSFLETRPFILTFCQAIFYGAPELGPQVVPFWFPIKAIQTGTGVRLSLDLVFFVEAALCGVGLQTTKVKQPIF